MFREQVYHQPVIIDSQEPSSSGGGDTTSDASGTAPADASSSTPDAIIKQQGAEDDHDVEDAKKIVTESNGEIDEVAKNAKITDNSELVKVSEEDAQDEMKESQEIERKIPSVESEVTSKVVTKKDEGSAENATQSQEKDRKEDDVSGNLNEKAKGDDENIDQKESSDPQLPPPPFDGETMEVEVAGQEHDISMEVSVGDDAASRSIDTRYLSGLELMFSSPLTFQNLLSVKIRQRRKVKGTRSRCPTTLTSQMISSSSTCRQRERMKKGTKEI